ncbi:hypothetical protein EG352_19100 [Chryseobacterium indologenes]|uniref:Uncharacterized protein n=2 Tax=Chryseobacterium indologenes TaxID=253 RepID=A0AAD0YVB2_CHRID|nr:hypothetical protein [Chryseobacterium indologenes]AZB19729.1 hypothetical protein EG352_19100 [Chryseobacterium indologenes]
MEKAGCQFGAEAIKKDKHKNKKMNYVNFVGYLANLDNLDDLYIEFNADSESEALIVCLKDSLDMNSEVAIFGIEETDGDLIFEKDENKYVELFPLEMTQEMIEEYINTYKGISNIKIAESLLNYRINDA